MKKSLRIGLGIVGLVAVSAMVQAPAAKADGFSGTFRGPHGQFSIHIGNPSYPVGSYAPYGHRVYQRSSYGYGFDSPAFYCRSHRTHHGHWVPVRRHQSRWMIVERPIVIVDNDRYYGRQGYSDRGYRDNYRYSDRRNDRRYDDRRYDRNDRNDRNNRYDRNDDGRYRRDSRSEGKRKQTRDRDRGWRN